MTVEDHFKLVASVYDSLRTTDEAPVRKIRELLPDGPLVGLDLGCGTGRYSRLLHGMLPDGSLLAASDLSAAMLAGSGRAVTAAPPWCHCGVPPRICRSGPGAWTWSRRSTACTTLTWDGSWPRSPER